MPYRRDQLHVRMSRLELAALDLLAARAETSRSEVVRALIVVAAGGVPAVADPDESDDIAALPALETVLASIPGKYDPLAYDPLD